MHIFDIIYGVFTLLVYAVFGLTCFYVGLKRGERKGFKKGCMEGATFVSNRVREIIKGGGTKMLDENGYRFFLKTETNQQFVILDNEHGPFEGDVPLIGGTIYSVFPNDIDDDDDGYHIERGTIWGSGITKDGEIYVLTSDKEIFTLDDEEEGLSFSTREKAERYLKGLEKNGM